MEVDDSESERTLAACEERVDNKRIQHKIQCINNDYSRSEYSDEGNGQQ